MIDPHKLFHFLRINGVNQYVGVPDSVLKNFLSIIPEKKNFISNNEGSAVAYGIGYHLATRKLPLVYLQNSGLGNAINPLISIAHPRVYSIPLILLIGWRGAPKMKDEPQHQAQGEITQDFLKLIGIKFITLNNSKDLIKIKSLISFSKKKNRPVAILIKNNKFQNKIVKSKSKKYETDIKRINFLEILLNKIAKNCKIISTTGFASREVNQLRNQNNLGNGSDFYMVGGMGHVSNVALGYSKYSKKKVLNLDGDGSILMHLGSMVNTGVMADKNYKYILLNNGCHESVGSQKTLINKVNLKLFSKSIGFNKYIELKKAKNIEKILKLFLKSKEKAFLNVIIQEGSIPNLTRPKNFLEIKKRFIEN